VSSRPVTTAPSDLSLDRPAGWDLIREEENGGCRNTNSGGMLARGSPPLGQQYAVNAIRQSIERPILEIIGSAG
jgi:hypothetical protein